MATEPEAEANSPIPTTEVDTSAPGEYVPSTVTEEEYRAISDILHAAYNYRLANGHDPSRIFHRKVNKRSAPDYYDVIKEPMALSVIKHKLNTRTYKSFSEFVRDFALIPHNAQVYNRPESIAFHDALEVKKLLESELKKLVEDKLITEEIATLPYLGEIPEADPLPAAEEEEDDDEDDEDEGEESDDSRTKKRGRGRPKGSTNAKREEAAREEAQRLAEIESGKKRGRPPRVDTPMEARIKNILKGMRKFKNSAGDLKINNFDRLPDKAAMPEYFAEIKQPMAVDVLKKKTKRKKYMSVEQFMKDVDLMFENAKQYNTDDSEIYKDAVELQREVRKIAEEEQNKPDTDFAMEDGRLPLPDGILHKGELYKVGDWVHIQNANDLTKPIVTQIYRTWQDSSGQKFVNACWYYRPEQTVHRFDKHFYEKEVVKTGQYRDHSIDEVIDRCFVMFVTRFNKGRPRNFPPDKEIYVCEARYNEEKHTLNKIKTWASCLPDEVRDKDYEMELYAEPKKMKKQPSPIAYLLKDDAKETDDLPKPEWGADNAPPKIGAVHKRPRELKDSPPPEPTPSPPPADPTPPPARSTPVQTIPAASDYTREAQNIAMMNTAQHQPSFSATPSAPQMMTNIQAPRTYQPNLSPATAPRPPSSAKPSFASSHSTFMQQPSQATPQHYSNTPRYPVSHQYTPTYKAPPPTEVWHLDSTANASIPPHIRQLFNCNEDGHVLFYTAPPVESPPIGKPEANLGHSVQFLAERSKRQAMKAEYRKRKAEAALELRKKRQATAHQERDTRNKLMEDITFTAMKAWEDQMIDMTEAEYRKQHGERWLEAMERDLEHLDAAQVEAVRRSEDKLQKEQTIM